MYLKHDQLPVLQREKENLEARLEQVMSDKTARLTMSQQTTSELEYEIVRWKTEVQTKQAQVDHYQGQLQKLDQAKQ